MSIRFIGSVMHQLLVRIKDFAVMLLIFVIIAQKMRLLDIHLLPVLQFYLFIFSSRMPDGDIFNKWIGVIDSI